MKKTTRTKHTIYLVIAIAVTLFGILTIMTSNLLYQFRLDGGWSYVSNANLILQITHAYVVMAIEWITGLVGIIIAVFGGVLVYINVNDLKEGR